MGSIASVSLCSRERPHIAPHIGYSIIYLISNASFLHHHRIRLKRWDRQSASLSNLSPQHILDNYQQEHRVFWSDTSLLASPLVIQPSISTRIPHQFEEACVQWYCLKGIRGMYVRRVAHSWPITVAVTPQDISQVASATTTSNGEQESDALELPPDVCACVAQCLTDCDLLGTCASLNAVSRQVQFATLPALYRVLVWKSFSWELTSLNQPVTWDLRAMREYGDEYWEKTRMWRRMITGPGAKYIEFILDFVLDFPHMRQHSGSELPAIPESIALGVLPRLKATVAVAPRGFVCQLHSFSFGSQDIFLLVACLDRLPPPPSRYFEGHELVIKGCRRTVLNRMSQEAVPPSLHLIIFGLELDFVQGITTSKGDDRYLPSRLARFYDAAVVDALMILSPRSRLLSPEYIGARGNHGRPCYLSIHAPNVQEAKLVASSLARTIRQDRLHALVETCVHVPATCTVDDVNEILSTLAPVYLQEAPWFCPLLLPYARAFRVTGFLSGLSGTLGFGVRTGLLKLRIRHREDRIIREDSFEFEPKPTMPGAGFFHTNDASSPIRT